MAKANQMLISQFNQRHQMIQRHALQPILHEKKRKSAS
jgi:hypothetical protein